MAPSQNPSHCRRVADYEQCFKFNNGELTQVKPRTPKVSTIPIARTYNTFDNNESKLRRSRAQRKRPPRSDPRSIQIESPTNRDRVLDLRICIDSSKRAETVSERPNVPVTVQSIGESDTQNLDESRRPSSESRCENMSFSNQAEVELGEGGTAFLTSGLLSPWTQIDGRPGNSMLPEQQSPSTPRSDPHFGANSLGLHSSPADVEQGLSNSSRLSDVSNPSGSSRPSILSDIQAQDPLNTFQSRIPEHPSSSNPSGTCHHSFVTFRFVYCAGCGYCPAEEGSQGIPSAEHRGEAVSHQRQSQPLPQYTNVNSLNAPGEEINHQVHSLMSNPNSWIQSQDAAFAFSRALNSNCIAETSTSNNGTSVYGGSPRGGSRVHPVRPLLEIPAHTAYREPLSATISASESPAGASSFYLTPTSTISQNFSPSSASAPMSATRIDEPFDCLFSGAAV